MGPNILFITTDQHRWDFLGCSGGPACSPHIDNLAAEGVYFSNCITNAPVCAAARCSLATGIRPHRLGDNANATSLQPWHRTYYQQLRDSGYHVGCVGKLDLAKNLHDCGRDGAPPRTYSWGFTRPCDVEAQGYIGIHDYPVGPYGRYLAANGLWDIYYADMAERLKRWFLHDVHDNVLPTEHTHDSFIGRKALQRIHGTNPGVACIRTGTHKYVRNDNDRDELYNLNDDPWETINLLARDDAVKKNKTIGNELRRKMQRAMGGQWQWREACL
jgi:arylsulfatase